MTLVLIVIVAIITLELSLGEGTENFPYVACRVLDRRDDQL